jgi:hypothetical protein
MRGLLAFFCDPLFHALDLATLDMQVAAVMRHRLFPLLLCMVCMVTLHLCMVCV